MARQHQPAAIGAAEVLDLIRLMSPAERKRLIDALERIPNPLGEYVCVPHELIPLMDKVGALLPYLMRKFLPIIQRYEEKRRHRNRKSDPEIIRRNVEICRLKEENPKYWTLEQLRRKYKFKHVRAVTKIVEKRAMWLRLAADLERAPQPGPD
jgi:hypothetical protein